MLRHRRRCSCFCHGGGTQMYGLCGFEISESYFKQNFAQPTGFGPAELPAGPAGDGLPPMPPSAAAPPAATTMPRTR